MWHETGERNWQPRPALGSDIDVDVAIVGGGLTGLWTAYYLRARNPSIRIAIVEADVVGFGASGRNGGWCSALLPMSIEAMTHTHSHDLAVRLQRIMFDTVDEVGRVTEREGIECDFAKGGTTSMARTNVQADRLRAAVANMHEHGFTDDDYRWLSVDDARQHVTATRMFGAKYTPHCAALHPTRLTRGLAAAVEAQGTTIYEASKVTEIGPRRLRTAHGSVRADVVVQATEAFTSQLAGQRRTITPVYSLMIATEPLPDSVFDTIGLARRETFNDARRMVIYGQRTADNRLAFGGRGAPYHFGSAMRPEFEQDGTTHQRIHDTLVDLFPAIGDASITHRWGGAVGIPRDWWCFARFDRTTGMASAGGYVGDGLSTTNLSGRTLADLITGTASELVELPWVGHRSRAWEPEPLRWIGINGMVKLPAGADAYEERTGRAERWRSAILNRVTGH